MTGPLTPDEQLDANKNIPAGQAGSPWSAAPTPAKVPSINPNNNQTPQQPTTPFISQPIYNADGTVSTANADGTTTRSINPNATPQQIAAISAGANNNTPVAGTNSNVGANGQPVSATNPPAPKTEGELMSDALQNSQGLINSINASTQAQLDQQNGANQAAQKDAEYAAAAGGMMGTPAGGAAIEGAAQKGAQANQTIIANGQQQIASILQSIAQNAQTTALAQTQQNFQNEGTAQNNQATIQANQSNAQTALKGLASIPGFNYNSFKNSPYYQQLVSQSGMDADTMDMYFNSLLPIAQQIQWQAPITDANGNTILYGTDPTNNNALVTKTISGGPPAGTNYVMKNGLPFYQQQNADGTPNPNGILIPAPLTASEKTAQTQEYQVYVAQQTSSGEPVLSFFDWQVATKTASTQFTQTGNIPTSSNPQPNSSSSNSSSTSTGAFAQVQSDPTSSASVNNLIGLENPGGQIINGSKFVSYPDLQTGITQGTSAVASRLQSLSSINPNATIMDLSNSWKGTGNNDASAWAASVASSLGVPINTKLSTLDPQATFYAIANHESSFVPTIANGATPQQVQKYLTSGPKVAGYDQGTLYNAAIQDMLGIPLTVVGGMGSASARKALGNKETDVMNAFGLSPTDVATAKAEYSALDASNAKLVNTAAYIKTYTGTATDNLNLALAQSANVPRSGAKLPNKWLQWFQGNYTPAGPLAQFETYIYTAAREYAKVTSGGATSGAGLTDSAQAEADKLLNASQSPEAFKAVVQSMQQDMANVNSNFTSQLSSFAPSVANLLGLATNSGGSSSSPNANSGGDYQSYLSSIGGQ